MARYRSAAAIMADDGVDRATSSTHLLELLEVP